MKLLGRLHLGPKRSDKHNDPSTVNNNKNSTYSNHGTSPFRRKKRELKSRSSQVSSVRPVPAPALTRHVGTSISHSNNSIISIPTIGYDDNTIDANTLYEWSLADNAPSIGSAGDLFLSEGAGNGNGHVGKKERGYGSSSDEDDDEIEDGNEENTQNFNYCKLSDSPPRKPKINPKPVEEEDETPIRKGKGLQYRSNNFMNVRKLSYDTPNRNRSPEKLKSPNKIKSRIHRRKPSPKHTPVQSLRRTNSFDSGPVDVDSFFDEQDTSLDERMNHGHGHGKQKSVEYHLRRQGSDKSSNSSKSNNRNPVEYHLRRHSDNSSNSSKSNNKKPIKEKPLPAELKGRIHAMSFDDDDNDDNLNSSYESNRSGDVSCSLDNASVRNLGNNNSPKKFMRNSPKKSAKEITEESFFSSTKNVGDSNSPMQMIQKKLSEMEPDFTFSISEEDLFGTDIDSVAATAWLLNDGEDDSSVTDLGQFKKQWELESLQADIQHDLKSDISTEASGINGKRFRKKVKDQMKSKFQSIVSKKKNKANLSYASSDHGSRGGINSSRVEKARLKRNQSGVSITPLTGIEDQPGIRIGKARNDRELAREVHRRKEIERRDIERRHQENQQRLMLEKNRRQRLRDAHKWKAGTINESQKTDKAVAKPESLDRLHNRKKLEKWMMGAVDDNEKSHDDMHREPKQNMISDEVTQSYLPYVYDESISAMGISYNTETTARINNTTTHKNVHTGSFDLDAYFPEEDSTAQTPEATAPATHDFSCVLCKTAERTHLAVPCMHFSFCGECVTKLEQKSGDLCCSVCNEKVTKFSKVFY